MTTSRRLRLVRQHDKRDAKCVCERLTLVGGDWTLTVELSLQGRALEFESALVEQLLNAPLGLLAGRLDLLDES